MRKFHWILCGVLLAGCSHVGSGSSPLPTQPQIERQPRASGFSSIYLFNGTDGAGPAGKLTAVNGALWGTTVFGGNGNSGTVFSVSPSGTRNFLYQFGLAAGNGTNPAAGMIYVNGAYYGTTQSGNANCPNGDVFEIVSKKASVLYCFQGGNDGKYPAANLIYAKGKLYGTTLNGGAANDGTVFSISPSGSGYRVLHTFTGGATDGANPQAGLAYVKGSLYGTTVNGGIGGYGVVFKLTTTGAENVLYNFKAGSDGAHPYASLIVANGGMYGTTKFGGTTGYGTIFKVSVDGAYRHVYTFKGGNLDGAFPAASLTRLNGSLYGTTYAGGGSGCIASSSSGCGTVFELAIPGSTYSVLHNFAGYDGSNPAASLTAMGGALYGTTQNGGNGSGTIFEVTPG